jgi:hypothetical protein
MTRKNEPKVAEKPADQHELERVAGDREQMSNVHPGPPEIPLDPGDITIESVPPATTEGRE